MIAGVHTMFYSSEPAALRAFLRDKLKLHGTDVGEGWLIFDVPDAEMGCHPADAPNGAPSGTAHISFYCDDVRQTMAELTSRGVEFTDPVMDMGYGLVTFFKAPGDFKIQLYQPRYVRKPAPKPAESKGRRAAKKKPAKAASKKAAKKRKEK